MVRHIFFSIILLISVCSVQAQMRRVALNNNASNVIDVFELGVVDVQPTFPGGECEMINFINDKRCYPADAYQNNIQGRVMCSFIVCPDGTIGNIEVLKSVCSSIDNEAVRIIKQMPRWSAGKINGKKVYVRCVVTIPFRL